MHLFLRLLHKAHPFVGPAVIVGVRYGFADIGVQTIENQNKNSSEENNNNCIDWQRVRKYTLFGFLQKFFVFNPLYVTVYPIAIRRMGIGKFGGVAMSLFDATVSTPIFYFPTFYALSQHTQSGTVSVGKVLQRCRENLAKDALSCALFWIPAHSLNFTLVPLRWRGYYGAVVGIAWSAIFSYLNK